MPHDHNSAIDWPGIRAAALVLGVREAARQAAANLPDIEKERFVFRVLKRSKREGWIREKLMSSLSSKPYNPGKKLSSNVVTGAGALANGLAEMSSDTRIGLAMLAKRSVDRANRSNVELKVSSTKELRELTAAASEIGAWRQAEGQHQTLVNVNILNS